MPSRQGNLSRRGDQCSDASFNLTAPQQERYKSLKVVSSQPVVTARGDCLAVLTISSHQDDGQLVSADGQMRHGLLAVAVGRILIDILRLNGD